MKKYILIILIFPAFIFGQTTEKKSLEWNFGVASVVEYDFSDIVFPGLSVLYIKTTSYSSGLVKEAQIGLAAPSIMTAKLGVGAGSLDKNILFTVRPWPFFIGPQLKLHNFTASFEIGLNNGVSGFSGIIATIGYRRPLKGKRWILKKSEKFETI